MDIRNVRGKPLVLALSLLVACVAPQRAQPPTLQPRPTVSTQPTATPEPTITVAPTPATTLTSTPDPLEQIDQVVRKLIALNKQGALDSAEGKGLFAGELADWDSPTLGDIISEPGPVVMLSPSTAVTRIQVMEGYTFDAYLYLSLDWTWQITAMRAMALPGFLRQTYVELLDKQQLSPDEAEVLHEFAPLFMTDQDWRDWFGQNRHSLEVICAGLTDVPDGALPITAADIGRYPGIEEAFTALHITSIEREQSGNTFMTTAGMVDNSVGILRSPGETPPPMSPGEFIWIEQLAEGWYLFRTT